MSRPDALKVGLAVLERFTRHNARREAQGTALREAIREFDEAHPGPAKLTAEAVLSQLARLGAARLGRDTLPSPRTVQLHLQHIRAARRRCAGA